MTKNVTKNVTKKRDQKRNEKRNEKRDQKKNDVTHGHAMMGISLNGTISFGARILTQQNIYHRNDISDEGISITFFERCTGRN